MRKLGWFLVALTIVPSPLSAESASISDEPAFVHGIAMIRADANNYDKFKDPVATGLVGHSFKLTLPFASDSEGSGTAVYDYQDGNLILDVSPSTAWPLLAGPSEKMPVLLVSSATKNLGTYVGQNAYGTTARVTSFRNLGAGIALVTAPKPMLSPMRTRMGASVLENTDWWISLGLAPSEAKALALNTVAIIEGTYAKLPSGSEGFCDSSGVSATIDEPANYHSEKCFVGAVVTRIALVNRKNETVLKEWTSNRDAALGPELWGGIRVGMNKYQLKEAQPSITDYGYFETGGHNVQVEMAKGVVSKVEIRYPGTSGMALLNMLSAQYGQPMSTKCFGDLCQAKWNINGEVAAYLGIGTGVTYQLSSDTPPIGFSD